jgi:hypothetical protein
MPVSHALISAVSGTDEQVRGLLEVLAQVTGPRRERGRRFTLVFVLAVAVVCVLAGAKSFREIGGQAGDLPQGLLARLGGKPHPLRRRITAPGEKRIRALLQDLDAAALDAVTGGWLRAMAAAGRPDSLPTAIAIDGKWLRGVADGQVKRFAAMLHDDGVIIAQHRIPDDTNEITQVRELLEPADLTGAVVTADAAHAQPDTAEYIAGVTGPDYLLTVEHASHCSCCWSWCVKESSLAVSGLDTEPFAASLGEVDGVELAALDLVQHGLAGDAEAGGGLAEGQPAVGCLGPDAVAELLVDADLPGCSGGELLAGDEAVA